MPPSHYVEGAIMAETEAMAMAGVQDQQQPPAARPVERLNQAVQQQLNLDSVKTRAISLFKAISRILEDFDAIARTNASPKWYSNAFFESNRFIRVLVPSEFLFWILCVQARYTGAVLDGKSGALQYC